MSMDNVPGDSGSKGSRSDVYVQNAAVRKYLEANEKGKNKSKFRRSPERIMARIADIDAEVPNAPVLKRLSLLQEKANLESGLAEKDTQVDMAALEAGFVKHAGGFATRKNISYGVWRTVGVAPELLQRAGISR